MSRGLRAVSRRLTIGRWAVSTPAAAVGGQIIDSSDATTRRPDQHSWPLVRAYDGAARRAWRISQCPD
jgi:hypothetical protein